MLERLHKVLARAGVAALRPAEDMIMAGRVTVNGRVVRELGARVDPDTDSIAVDGTTIDIPAPTDPHRYVMLHKPVDVISTAKDTHERPTVVDLIPSDDRLFPVGRLDADSEGLILLTNDGDLAYRLTHPSFEVEKEYRVLLDRTPELADLRRWREGVELEGQMTLPVWAEILDRLPDGTWVRIVMREGRNRQIRNVAELLGYQVLRLMRVREGPISLGDLESGQWRELTAAEVDALRAHVRHVPSQEADRRRAERDTPRERIASDRRPDAPRSGSPSGPRRSAPGDRRPDDRTRAPRADRPSGTGPRRPDSSGAGRSAAPPRGRGPGASSPNSGVPSQRSGGLRSGLGRSYAGNRSEGAGGRDQRSGSRDSRSPSRTQGGIREGLGNKGGSGQRSRPDARTDANRRTTRYDTARPGDSGPGHGRSTAPRRPSGPASRPARNDGRSAPRSADRRAPAPRRTGDEGGTRSPRPPRTRRDDE